MLAILVFAGALFVAALISEYAHRSIVSTSVLFLMVGFFAGPAFLGAITLEVRSDTLSTLAEIAMFTVLFTDGMEIDAKKLKRAWRLPSLALGIGLPLTVIGTAVLAHFVGQLDWLSALIVGAVLSPTDPVFASAIVGRREIPAKLRNLLNIESGLNDALALPLVVTFVALATEAHVSAVRMLTDIVLGVALGVGVPWVGHLVEQLKAFNVAQRFEPLFALSLGLVIFAAASLTGVNLFVAAFTAGIAIATIEPRFRKTFCDFGEVVAELLKLATVMCFGAVLSPEFLRHVPASGYLFGVLTLILVRPLALQIAFSGANLHAHERIAAYWFGPKGFASIYFGIQVLRSDVPQSAEVFRLIAVVVTLSIIAHSSTDVIVARWFQPGGGGRPSSGEPLPPAQPAG
jgi:NhaP-type Na+/H+ or K+/H+ antiporter